VIRCLSSLGCPDCSLAETLAIAARHRIDAVELRSLGGTVVLPAYLRAQFGSPADFGAALRGSSVRVAAFNASLKLAGATPGDREEFLEYVPWAEAAGVRWLRVFDGGKNADDAELAHMADTVRWWQALRRERGWQADLMVETHDSLVTTDAIRRFRAVAPGAAVLWDAHHTWRKGGEDPAATWEAIRDAVVHVHVKDSIPVPSARHPFTYVLPGDGGFPIQRLLAAISATGFEGCVSLEWERLWHPYLPPLEEALRMAASRRWW
jgi:sugar phosphate isomerase/epimerase